VAGGPRSKLIVCDAFIIREGVKDLDHDVGQARYYDFNAWSEDKRVEKLGYIQ